MTGMLRARTRLLAIALLACAVAAPAASARKVTVGIADQKPAFFDDSRFRALGVNHARLVVPWDAHKYDWQMERLDKWLQAAQRTGTVPLVVFGRSVTVQYRTMLPSADDFAETVQAFRARYPWVREFATWNEPNHCSQPTCHDPARVAAYYDVLAAECKGCRVLGASVLGVEGMRPWLKKFLAAAHSTPRYWGLHNYLDVNSYVRASTRAFLRAVKGEVWLTETAGIVR
jgi:polysaccharide biosynthesis protein PslG